MLNTASRPSSKNAKALEALGQTPDTALTRDLDDADIRAIFNKDVYQDVISSEAFQRLKEIRFLGAIDYVIHAAANKARKGHSRFQHSLGVASLAIQYARLCKLSEHEEVNLTVAGLLHDIGHAPLSHSLERNFNSRFGLNHHLASEMIILGKVPVGTQLRPIFKKYNIDPALILDLIGGKRPEPLVEPFRNPINIDTVEAIIRSYTYISTNLAVTLPSRVLRAFVRKSSSDIVVLDDFWRLKDTVYSQLIMSKMGLLADYTCQQYMESHSNIYAGMYFHTESQLRRHHPELFDQLRRLKAPKLFREKLLKVAYRRRRFIVEPTVRIRTAADMYRRYTQTSEKAVLEIQL